MKIFQVNSANSFRSNIIFDIGGSQKEGSCKIYYETTKGSVPIDKRNTILNKIGNTNFENGDAFIGKIVEKIKLVQDENAINIADKGFSSSENRLKNIAIFLPSYTSGLKAYYLPNHRNGLNKPLKDLNFKNFKKLLVQNGIDVSPKVNFKILHDALGTGLAMAKKLNDKNMLKKGSYYTACITGGGCGIANIEMIDEDNIIIKSSGSNYLSQSLSLQKVSRAGASAPAVIENFCKAFGLNDEQINDIKSCHKAEFTLNNPITYEKNQKTEKLKEILLHTEKYELVNEDEKTYTLKVKKKHKSRFNLARRNAIDKYCLAFARLAIIKKTEGSNGLIITGPLANSINEKAQKHYGQSVSQWVSAHLAQSFNNFELEIMQDAYKFKVYCGEDFKINDNTDCKDLAYKAKFLSKERGNWVKITLDDLNNSTMD